MICLTHNEPDHSVFSAGMSSPKWFVGNNYRGVSCLCAIHGMVVQHLDPRYPSLMADILSRRTHLRVKQVQAGDIIKPGTVYIAPPNRHLLANPNGTLALSQSKMVHFLRPAADLLFESVAASYRERAIAVVLTGTGNDGAMGVQAIKKMGGVVLAQDAETAEFSGMPNAAIKSGSVDCILPLHDIPRVLTDLVLHRRAE